MIIARVIIAFICLLHLYIMWLEMFAWTTRAKKVFRKFPEDLFEKTKPLAANQGLYNGFLAAGLLWSFFIKDEVWSANVAAFFLLCVLTAGLYGAITAQRSILYIQALPALLGLLALYFEV
ncbi:DUF1304 family protein [Flavobacterium sp. Sd200]|uniref:DUF1304 domain-containing protein n=1 Tax=Flavobacterium sp. Sd200 TaxID=2692211 RepID=UPI00136CFA63|nr:DUF1304 domain-containing protein [Flavobacterium sp. Sd200]MXN89909.1 DUF1304 family protein [Flavobacterium sp. Sd200]